MATKHEPTVPPWIADRLTPQRRAVLQALAKSHDHPTAAEIYERARKAAPGISFATVYNSLRFFKDNGLILELPGPNGASRYDATIEPHAHAHCSRCGDVVDIPLPAELKPQVDSWRVDEVRISITGLCPSCRAATTH